MENPVKRQLGIRGMIAALVYGSNEKDCTTSPIYSGMSSRTSGYSMNYKNIIKAKIRNKRRRANAPN